MKHLDVLCFGGEDWWYHNRGHIDMQMMRRFARIGKTVYVNSIVMQKPSFKKSTAGGRSLSQKILRKSRSIFRGLQLGDGGFWVYSPLSLPVQHIRSLRPLNEFIIRSQLSIALRRLRIRRPVVWVVCPVTAKIAIKMPKSKLVYQRTDRFEEYPNVDAELVHQCDTELKESADLTVFVSKKLYDEEKSQCRNALYIDHGVDFEMFATAEQDTAMPEDMVSIPKPIVGFFGGIDNHTSDIELVRQVVDLLPEMSFVFVGKASSDCSGFESRPNVWMLGQKPYEEIPHYGKLFDVAIMPWQQNRWIQACNPIKLKEYLALGKPIVSTPFPQLDEHNGLVYQARTPGEFAEKIATAISENETDAVKARRDRVKSTTWDAKAEEVLVRLYGEEGAGKL